MIVASTYEVLEQLGAGGGGTVFLANHVRLGKTVVLKADKRKITTRPDLLRREVDILKELSHPRIPKVYDFFAEGETVYTVMDFIEGESLDKPLKRGERFSQAQVILWAKQILEALSYLHSPVHGSPARGFVHSDIKPANLMWTKDGICLIDFNIALALGEENSIGRSAGYASPEHYGLDFSSQGDTESVEKATSLLEERGATEVLNTYEGETIPDSGIRSKAAENRKNGTGTSGKNLIVPDIRSDIYSTGATLYHLLSGQRPNRNAKEVTPLSGKEFSPPLVKIISKAMNPNPDLRYQTADEMLWDLTHIRERDPRVRRLKMLRAVGGILFTALFTAGSGGAFVGLKRMETTESWLKLAEYSANALAEGDTDLAIQYALSALPTEKSILLPEYTAEAQRALTNAMNVYDLADGYKSHKAVALPSEPFFMAISPDGKTAACVYAYSAAVIDTETSEIIAALPAQESALSEVKYLDNHRIVYAGRDGITVYDLEKQASLWTGNPATAISISGDGTCVAAVYKNDKFATVYDAKTGQIKHKVDFGERRQRVTVNDRFANPQDNLLALNDGGSLLGVSFEDGSLEIFNLEDPDRDIILFEAGSGYTHFEGGFYQQYFAFSAAGESNPIFAVIDTAEGIQTGGFEMDSVFGVQADESGIYVQTNNLLVKIDPVTGEQMPLVTTADPILRFARSRLHTLVTSEKQFEFFDARANPVASYGKENGCEFVQLAEGTAVLGGRDSPNIRILKYEGHSDKEVFSYDPAYAHDEARMSGDGKTVMLFSYDNFRIYSIDGELIKEESIPDSKQVYDQQYRRKDDKSWLEVVYNDGRIRTYSGADGSVLEETMGETPDLSLYEEFYTDRLRIESPLHGTPAAYDRKTGKLVGLLEPDAYLTYVTQAGEYIITQYVTTEGYYYGQVLDEKCRILAELPYVCDVIEEKIIFDYPTGNLRESHIYSIHELITMAQSKNQGGKGK